MECEFCSIAVQKDNYAVHLEINSMQMNIKLLLIVVSSMFFMACGNREDARLACLDSIDVELEINAMPDLLNLFKVREFRPVFGQDSSLVHVIATFYRGNTCALDFYSIPPRGDSREGKTIQHGHAMTYDEQMAMLRKVTRICRERYNTKRFCHLRFDFDNMGDINEELTAEYHRILRDDKPIDSEDAFLQAIRESQLVKDLQLLFPSDSIQLDADGIYDLVYSHYTAEFRLKQRPHFYQVGRETAAVVDAE